MEASGDTRSCKPAAGLYIVATPIGNVGDISLRALHVLAGADIIACEDTRVTGALLHRYGIKKTLISYHEHNADARGTMLMKHLAGGEVVALVSDAGTPLISDPGYQLVAAARAVEVTVTVVPGASALLTALVGAGLPTDKFLFVGFLPVKAAARQNILEEYGAVAATLIFYEAPSRVAESLAAMEKKLGADRPAVVARELTKLFEETQRGTLQELAEKYANKTVKGEVVIIIGPPSAGEKAVVDIEGLLEQALRTQTLRDAVEAVAAATGSKKSVVYQRALALTKKS